MVNTTITRSDYVNIEGNNQVMNVSRNKHGEYVGDKTVRETDKQWNTMNENKRLVLEKTVKMHLLFKQPREDFDLCEEVQTPFKQNKDAFIVKQDQSASLVQHESMLS